MRSRWITAVGVLLGVVLAAGVVLVQEAGGHAGHASSPPTRVLVIGGSAARGWRARQNVGYIDRAFRAYGRVAGVRYVLYNRGIPGAGVEHPVVTREYGRWLRLVSPGIVVLAWGTLNDLRLGTPVHTVTAKIREEIALALEAHNVVLLVTPIPTQATYTIYRTRQPALVLAAVRVATGFQNGNVHVLDLFSTMRAYLKTHGLSYQAIMHDRWDPGERGHAIAARLLLALMRRTFHDAPLTFRPGPTPMAGRIAASPLRWLPLLPTL
jgi:acyl-CoA thioesterase-1